MDVTTVGLDLAKSIFQVHGVTDAGALAFNRSLGRAQILSFVARFEPCLVGMEACGTSHYWARELTKLGDLVRFLPPSYVKPYVMHGILAEFGLVIGQGVGRAIGFAKGIIGGD